MRRSFPWLALAVLMAAPTLDATEVAKGVHVLTGGFTPGSQPDGNTVIFQAKEGLVVIDTGRHAGHTRKILDFARTAKTPVKAVINTHWHLDHVSGNAKIREAFPKVRVIASSAIEGAMKGFLKSYRGQLEEMIGKTKDPRQTTEWKDEISRIDAGRALFPDDVVTTSGPRDVAGRRFNVFLEKRSVTEGDLWLFDSSTGVLVAGDLVTLPVPFLDTACPSRWRASLERVSQQEFKVLVPGHGSPMSRKDFQAYKTAFGHLLDCAASSRPDAECVDGWMRDASTLLTGEDSKFVRSLAEYYTGSLLRGETERLQKLCAETGTAPVPAAP